MKGFHFFIVVVLMAVTMGCSHNEQGFTLNGKAKFDPCLGKTVVMTIYNNDGTQTVDSTTIAADGTFRFTGKVESPCLAELKIRKGNEDFDAWFNCFIENTKMTLKVTEGEARGWMPYAKFTLKGSRTDKSYHKAFAKGYKEALGTESFEPYLSEELAANPNEVFTPYVYYSAKYDQANYDEFMNQMESFGPTARNTWHYRYMERMIQTKSALAIGQQMPAFELPDTAGNLVSLASVLKGNRLLLVDFWASWCGPCRKEGKRIHDLYNELHDKGLEVLGVSIDTERDSWIKAIVDDQIPWPNVCELDYSDSCVARRVFDIRGVPNIMLLDADGTIIATHLYGNELDSTVRANLQ